MREGAKEGEMYIYDFFERAGGVCPAMNVI